MITLERLQRIKAMAILQGVSEIILISKNILI